MHTLSPQLRGGTPETLLSRPAWLAALLHALETEEFAAANVDFARIELLAVRDFFANRVILFHPFLRLV